MIHVIATVEIAAGKRAEFLQEFGKVVPQVRAETGCIEYGPAIDLPTSIGAQLAVRDDVVTVIEKWDSLTDLEAHLIAPHMLEYRRRVSHLVQTTVVQVLEPMAGPAEA